MIGRTLAMFSACAVLFSACTTEPGETTAIGAATGGVIGAGLGAIVGAQTGDPGSGIAIGAVAGSAAGAMIGNEIQARDEELELREEMVRRQGASIDSQRSELEDLRRNVGDSDRGSADDTYASRSGTISRNGALTRQGSAARQASSGVGQVKNSSQDERARLDWQRSQDLAGRSVERPVASSRAVERVATAPAVVQKRSVATSGERPDLMQRLKPQTPEKQPIEAAVEQRLPARNTLSQENDIPVVEAAEERVEKRPSSIFSAVNSEPLVEPVSVAPNVERTVAAAAIANSPDVSEIEDPQAKSVAALSNPVPSMSEECRQADAEAQKASGSAAMPDKLFHLRRALRLCPGNPGFHVSLGEVYRTGDRVDDAEFEFREALKLNPGYSPALEKLKDMEQ